MAGFFRRVLVPLDTGPTAQQALPQLSHLLTGAASETVLAAVADDPFLADAARMFIDGIAHRMQHLGIAVRTRVDVGAPVEKVLEAARAEDADAILLPALFRPGLSHVVFEEVAEAVVRKSPRPVLVLRPGEPGPGRDRALKTLLVPLDGSPLSRQALPLAEALARSQGGRLVLVHVLPRASEPGPQGPPEEKGWDAPSAERALTEAARESAARGVDAGVRVTTGAPEEGILRTAESESADLIVMTTRGRGGLLQPPLGRVTDRILRSAAAPVLALSTPGREGAARAA